MIKTKHLVLTLVTLATASWLLYFVVAPRDQARSRPAIVPPSPETSVVFTESTIPEGQASIEAGPTRESVTPSKSAQGRIQQPNRVIGEAPAPPDPAEGSPARASDDLDHTGYGAFLSAQLERQTPDLRHAQAVRHDLVNMLYDADDDGTVVEDVACGPEFCRILLLHADSAAMERFRDKVMFGHVDMFAHGTTGRRIARDGDRERFALYIGRPGGGIPQGPPDLE